MGGGERRIYFDMEYQKKEKKKYARLYALGKQCHSSI